MKFYIGHSGSVLPRSFGTVEEAREEAKRLMIYDHRNITEVRIYKGELEPVESGHENGLEVTFAPEKEKEQ